eukprot:Skav231423  [mRNA]  locus=scaffold330:106793:108441:- [translate_table: standard]
MVSLWSCGPSDSRIPQGSKVTFTPLAIKAFRKASLALDPKHATSPVLCISTPTCGSEPLSRWKENIGALHATNSKS